MKISAQLDVNVVAVDVDDEVTIMLDVEAPPPSADLLRPPASLQIVLDRSGSMAGAPLDGAKSALIALVRQLECTDNFGLVTFDDSAQVVVPAGPIDDKESVIDQIRRIAPGGTTDLSAGLLRGLREIKRVAKTGGTVLFVSDGHVNAGLRQIEDFDSVTGKAYSDGIVTSTLGYGDHYDETLLAAIARAGSGNHVFASDPDAAGAAIAGEVEGLLSKSLQAVTLTLVLEPAVQMARLYNDLPSHELADRRIMIEIGDLYAHEKRRILLKLRVPAMSSLGAAKVATLELEYIELPGLIQHVANLPIAVNIVPGAEVAQRFVHPVVESEKLFQEAQHSKKLASEAFEQTQVAAAREHLLEAKAHLAHALELAPQESAHDIRQEIGAVDRMSEMAAERSTQYMSKLSRSSYHAMNRKRGRVDSSDADESDSL